MTPHCSKAWFTASGTIAGISAAVVIGPGGLTGPDQTANAHIEAAIANVALVAIDGIWTGEPGLDFEVQAAATVVGTFDDGVIFEPPRAVAEIPPGDVA